MTAGVLVIIERTTQARCGSSYVITLEPIKDVLSEKSLLLRVHLKDDPTIVIPCVLPHDSSLSEVSEIAQTLIEDLTADI